MEIVVTGATGNVGTAVLARLASDPAITRIVGIARRPPPLTSLPVEWFAADVGRDDLAPAMEGADAVIHLAWAIQPSHDLRALHATNVVGSERVVAAALDAGVTTFVHASSVGVYSRGPKDRPVDESWPRDGTPSSFYGRHKAAVEHMLDAVEPRAPHMRIVRMRPGLIFSREAASGIRRLFVGGLIPSALLAPRRIPVVPHAERLVFQAVHSADVGDAYHRALAAPAAGAINIAADPVIDTAVLARALGARRMPVPVPVLRAAVTASWAARLQPTPAGWLDMALAVPVMDCSRARAELGWAPSVASTDALVELLTGMAERSGAPTPHCIRPSRLRPGALRWVRPPRQAATRGARAGRSRGRSAPPRRPAATPRRPAPRSG